MKHTVNLSKNNKDVAKNTEKREKHTDNNDLLQLVIITIIVSFLILMSPLVNAFIW